MVISRSFALLLLILISCTMRLKPLLIERVDYEGNDFRIDGYYYYFGVTDDESYFEVYFFYKNGVAYHSSTTGTNCLEIENHILSEYHLQSMNNVPYRWGVYKVQGTEIQYSGWSTSVGGPYPAFKREWEILNDSTLYSREFDETWHFKEFSPKPDSTNRFIDANTLRHKPIHRINN